MRTTSTITTVTLVAVLITVACGAPGPSPVESSPASTLTPRTSVVPLASRRFPADVLDLTNWYLTLPTGTQRDPDTVHQPDLDRYGSAYFKLDDAKTGVIFTANAGGATTKGSNYPRSELREMNGNQKASWSNNAGTHTLSARQAVTTLPSTKPEVVTAQIHDANSDVMEVRLQGTRLIAQYDNGRTNTTLDPAYTLGTVYDLKIVAANNHVEVYYNGAKKADIQTSGSGWYFKSGSYVQTNTSKGDQADAVGAVVIYQLTVTHTN